MSDVRDYKNITPMQAVALLRQPYDAWVSARFTEHDTHDIKIVKSDMIAILEKFPEDIKIGVFIYDFTIDNKPVKQLFFDWIGVK